MSRILALLVFLTLSTAAFGDDECVSEQGLTFMDLLPSTLLTQISYVLSKNGDNMDDALDKLEFSLPGDPDFDGNARYSALRLITTYRERQFREVINDSRNWTKPSILKNWYDYAHPNSFVEQECIDRFTTKQGEHLIFNLRRHTMVRDGSKWEVLYGIVPNFDPARCRPEVDRCVISYDAGADFKIGANNHQIIEDPPDFPQGSVGGQTCGNHQKICVHSADGKVSLFFLIDGRSPRVQK
jgi:hypothetical protein